MAYVDTGRAPRPRSPSPPICSRFARTWWKHFPTHAAEALSEASFDQIFLSAFGFW